MSTRSVDSAFGIHQSNWADLSPAPITNAHEGTSDAQPAGDAAPASEVHWVNSELTSIASTIEELQSRLEQANSRLSTAAKVETTEIEIGRLFVEAQRFTEASLLDLEGRVQEVLRAAEAKAMQILAEATEEAQEIRLEAQQAAFESTATIRELQSAIAGFTTVNAELLKELGTLNGMLAPPHRPEAEERQSEVDGIPATELPAERD